MISSQTVEILSKLNKDELSRLGDFIKSPYFNSVKVLEKVHSELVKYYPDFNNEKLSYKSMFRKLYPGKEYSDKTARNLSTKFSKIVKSFVAYEAVRKDKYILDTSFAKGLSDIKLYDLSNKQIDSYRKFEEESDGNVDTYIFYNRFTLGYIYLQNLSKNHKAAGEEFYNNHCYTAENLIIFLFKAVTSLAYEQSIMNRFTVKNINKTLMDEFTDSLDFDRFIKNAGLSGHKDFFYLKINYLIYTLGSDKVSADRTPEDDFSELMKLVKENINKFNKLEQNAIVSAFNNILLSKLIPKNNKYYNELFETAKLFCSLKFYPDETFLEYSLLNFRIYFTVALLLKEYEWAQNFANEYVNYLPMEHRQNELIYCNGILYFKNKKYNESLNYFSKVTIEDIEEKIVVRLYTLMNYIEMNDIEGALSMLSSVRQFSIENKTIPPNKLTSLQTSLKFMNEIIKSLATGKKLDYAIYQEAKEVRKFYQKQYVTEKMESMI